MPKNTSNLIRLNHTPLNKNQIDAELFESNDKA